MNLTNEELLSKIIGIANRVGIPSESNELMDLQEEALLRMARGTTPRAADGANPPGKICEHGHYGACVECGTNNPPAANANR